MIDDDLFAWSYDLYYSEDTILETPDNYEEVKCTEMGCQKGWVLLLLSRTKCSACNGTGKVKKKK